ncbi:NepR family anti-sigma factor [Peteryoungia ipomoeae]|uniref:Anti-sigma factor NepR domain-containing protein n=1 Tax=Peteryoungia ipomoeae TaxID=1210932 RepID=A0A4S8NV47_9HYPH|nr:NepR family anti-sigma factor [Peteryoungia ipomoeae]THV20675.1 hypothetical protein FAA97_18960 [Peteryoungia ipomoeae]
MDNEKAPGSDHAGEDAGKTGIVDEKIGSRLKSYYDSIVDEGTPAHLLDLLERLHEAELKATKSDRQ